MTDSSQTTTNFGLINKSYEKDAEFDPEKKKTQWQRFENEVSRLNHESEKNTMYKVFFMGRHGEGYHNVAEDFYGTKAWDVSYFLFTHSTPNLYEGVKYLTSASVLLVPPRWQRNKQLGRCPPNPHRRRPSPQSERFLAPPHHRTKDPLPRNLLLLPLAQVLCYSLNNLHRPSPSCISPLQTPHQRAFP